MAALSAEGPVADRHRFRPAGRGRPTAPTLLLAAGMVAQVPLVLSHREGLWFRADSWHYLTRRGTIPGESLGLFEPWGGHWQTVPVLVYRGLYAAFGVRSYTPYLMTAVLLHLVVCGLLYAVLRRAGHGAWTALVPAWLLLFFGAGGEAFASDGPLPLMISLVFGLAAVLVALAEELSPRRLAAVAGLLLLGVVSSGLGLVFLGLIGLLLWMRQGIGRAVLVAAPAAVAFLVWFVAIGRNGGRAELGQWRVVPAFVWRGTATALHNVVGVTGAGVVLVIVLVATVLLVRAAPRAARQLAVVGLVAVVVQMALAALATPPKFGLAGAYQSRYSYLALVFLAPAVALLITALAARLAAVTGSRPGEPSRGVLAVGLLLLAAVTLQGVAYEVAVIGFLRNDAKPYRAWVLGSIAAVRDGEQVLVPDLPLPVTDPLQVRLLSSPIIARDLAAEQATPLQRLDAENQFFTYVGPLPVTTAPAPTGIDVVGARTDLLPGGRCQRLEPSGADMFVRWPVGESSQVTVRAGTARVSTVLRRDGIESPRVSWHTQTGPFVVVSTAAGAEIEVRLRGTGPYVVCVG